ncbi:hypothetical protein [Echinicola salinicaeni]|uniref:hypothetical protein n=1 Tax=Echinicola salinicaeni TaxID=2762757 RepID=UPI001645744E|nr:hypothetical protein [Echinicola salinicaeni]
MSVIIDRIGEFAKYTNRSIRKIELEIGAANGTLSKAIGRDKDVHTKWIALFMEHFPEVNPAWLLTGDGSMMLPTQKPGDSEHQPSNQFDEPIVEYQSKIIEQHKEVIASLKQVIAALEGQLKEKEIIVQLKDKIIANLEEQVKAYSKE